MFKAIHLSKNVRIIRQIESGRDELHFVCACTDGTVLVAKEDGTILWQALTGGFPFDLWVGDMNGDQADEILAASSDGVLYAFSSGGTALWTYQTSGPLFQVCPAAMGKSKMPTIFTGGADHHLYALDPDGKLIRKIEFPEGTVPGPIHDPENLCTGRGLIKFLRAGDLDGSGENTLLVSTNVRIMHHDFHFIKGADLTVVETIPRFEREVNEKRGHDFKTLEIFDLDGDGVDEMVFGQGSWKASGFWVYRKNQKSIRWKSLHEPDAMHRCDTVYRDTYLVPLKQEGKLRTVAVCGHQLCLLDTGQEIIQQAFSPCAFMGIAAYTHRGESGVLLASGLGGDGNVYRLEFGKNWVNEMEGYERSGEMADVSEKIEAIRSQIDASPDKSAPGEEPYIIQVGACYIYKQTVGEIPHYIKHNQWVRSQFPYPNLKFATFVAISEKQVNPRSHASLLGNRFEPYEVVEILKAFEAHQTPFMLYLATCTFISLAPKTIQRIIEACPNTFLGCYAAEMDFLCPMTERTKRIFEELLDSSIIPVLDLLKAHGRKFLMNEKGNFWITSALRAGVFTRLFNGTYRDVIIPCVEDSTTRSPELNLAGRVGLWLSGTVNRWGARATSDDYGNNHAMQGGAPVMSGHQALRKMVSQAALGATVFQFNCGQDNGSGEPCYRPTQGDLFFWTRVGLESEVPFLHLLGKGLLRPPRRSEMVGLSRVALAIDPSDDFIFAASNQAHFDDFTDAEINSENPFSRLSGEWSRAPSHPNHFSSWVFNQKQQGINFVPATPYGFVPIVPQKAVQDGKIEIADEQDERAFTLNAGYGTDGELGVINGVVMNSAEWRTKFLADLKESAKKLPFLAGGDVFMNAIKEENGYTLCLVDSDCVLLRDKKVTLKVQDEQITSLTDKHSGEVLPVTNGTLVFTIPAGTFRLLTIGG